MQAALLLSQLKRLDDQTRRRDENGRYLAELLGGDRRHLAARPRPGRDAPLLPPVHLPVRRGEVQQPAQTGVRQVAGGRGRAGLHGLSAPALQAAAVPGEEGSSALCHPPGRRLSNVRCPVAEKACAEEAVWIIAAGAARGPFGHGEFRRGRPQDPAPLPLLIVANQETRLRSRIFTRDGSSVSLILGALSSNRGVVRVTPVYMSSPSLAS